MTIYYNPPAVATVTQDTGIIGETVKKVMQENVMGPMQEAIANAIEQTIIIPLQTWLHSAWVVFIDTSFIMCLSIAFVGALFGVLGIKKGYKVMVVSIVFYFLIRLFSYLMGWY